MHVCINCCPHSDNYIGTAGAVMLSDHLAANTVLEELTLKGNELGDDGLTALCKCLQQRKRSLKVLDVGNNSLTEGGAAALAEWLPGAGELLELNVYMNDMGDGGAHKVRLVAGGRLRAPVVGRLQSSCVCFPVCVFSCVCVSCVCFSGCVFSWVCFPCVSSLCVYALCGD